VLIPASLIAEVDIHSEKLALMTVTVMGHQLLAHLLNMTCPAFGE
jgi:hypothetical protein